jgi:hypothetical protein
MDEASTCEAKLCAGPLIDAAQGTGLASAMTAQTRAINDMIDASDKRLLACLAKLSPRHELVVRMTLNARAGVT